MFTPLTDTGRIKVLSSRFQNRELSQCYQIPKVARSSHYQSWAACTMTIAELPELLSEKQAWPPEACAEYLKSRSYRCVESEQRVACRVPRRKDQTTWMFESWSVSSCLRLTRTSPSLIPCTEQSSKN